MIIRAKFERARFFIDRKRGISLGRIFIIVGFLLLLTGCNGEYVNELTVTKIEAHKVPEDVQQFIQGVEQDEGTFLYFAGKSKLYVFLNSGAVEQDEEVPYYDHVQVKGDGKTLNVIYEKSYTNDLADDDFTYRALYKIDLDQAYEHVIPIENGIAGGFDVVSGVAE